MNKKITFLGASILLGVGLIATLSNRELTANQKYAPRTMDGAAQSAKGMMEFFNTMRKNVVTGKVEASDFAKAREEVKAMLNQGTRAASLTFQLEGPDNYGGRTRAILVDQNDNNILYAGSVSGGLYKSTNRGNTWEVLPAFADVLSVTSLAQTNNGTIYIGTGTAFESPISSNNTGGHVADGLWYTEDGGATFQQLPSSFGAFTINELAADPNANDKVWVAGEGVIGLTSVENKTTITQAESGNFEDLQISNDGTLLVGSKNNQTWVSTDGGANFTRVSGPSPGQIKEIALTSITRIEYAISHEKNSNGMYNIFAAQVRSGGVLGMLGGISYSGDNGQTWTEIIPQTPNGVSAQDALPYDPYSGGSQWQGNYDNIITCIPGSPNSFLIGGVRLFRFDMSTTSPPFGNFYLAASNQASETSGIYVHSDIHEFVWDNTGRLYIGSDGGVGVSDDLQTFTTANRGYNTLQYYGISYSQFGDVVGGSQDNGTTYKNNNFAGTSGQEFRSVFGGDGFDCDISYFDPSIMFVTSQEGSFFRIEPNLQSGGLTSSANILDNSLSQENFPFFSVLRHYENPNDLNSTDSIEFITDSNYNVGDTIRVNSRNAQKLIEYPVNQPLTVVYDSTFILDTGSNPVDTTVDTLYTVMIQDRYQSLTAITSSGGVWVTRMGLRFSPAWYKVTNNTATCLEFSSDGDILYIGDYSGSVVRVKGFNNLYYDATARDTINDVPNHDSASYMYADIRGGNQQLEVTTIRSGGSQPVTGLAIDPNDPEHVVVTLGGFGAATNVLRSTTAASTTGTSSFTSIKGNLPTFPVYDAVIDYQNPNLIIVGTEMGVYATDNAGASWDPQLGEMGIVPSMSVRQQWRSITESTNSGSVYIGTHGRGLWSTAELAGVDEVKIDDDKTQVQLVKVYPNPANVQTTLSFDLKQTSDVVINVYNIQGKLIETKSIANAQEGNVTTTLNVSNYVKGTYLVNIQAQGTNYKVAKFIKK